MKNFIEIGIFVLILLIIIVSLKKSSFNDTPAQFDPTKQYYIKQKNYFGASDGYASVYYFQGYCHQVLTSTPPITKDTGSGSWSISNLGQIYVNIKNYNTPYYVFFLSVRAQDLPVPTKPSPLPEWAKTTIIPVHQKQDTYYIRNNTGMYISATPGSTSGQGFMWNMKSTPDQTCEFVITPV